MDSGFFAVHIMDTVVSLLLLFIGYSTMRGYQRTKYPSLRVLSIVFLSAGLIHIALQALEFTEIEELAETFAMFTHELLFVIALATLAWAVRWQPGWKRPLKPQRTA